MPDGPVRAFKGQRGGIPPKTSSVMSPQRLEISHGNIYAMKISKCYTPVFCFVSEILKDVQPSIPPWRTDMGAVGVLGNRWCGRGT